MCADKGDGGNSSAHFRKQRKRIFGIFKKFK